ncbi:MAG: hypothetical protein K2P58_15225 [Hyphomonadaceae bacterium]|nr:hypothetical protein [Hyphomonadaceae bacterium]
MQRQSMGDFRSADAIETDFEEVCEQRRADRRQRDRRTGRMRLDPLFAVVLLRHVAEAQSGGASGNYAVADAPVPVKGRQLNLRA